MAQDLIGSQLGKYRVLVEIGRGAAGMVFRGQDPDLERKVAIKVLDPLLGEDEEIVKRFRREARLMAQLNHPNIVTIYDVGQQRGQYYFVMEYLEGMALTKVVRQAPLSPSEALPVLRSLAGALDYAHEQGMVHRDVKPANVIIGPDGEVTLTDFGIVWSASESQLTADGTMVGTPRYMSPEQVMSVEVNGRSDQYSLAVIAYEMLSGQVPFQTENTASMLYKIAHENAPLIREVRPDLSAEVEQVLARALAQEPGDRFPLVISFVDALEQALGITKMEEGRAPTSSASGAPRLGPPARERRMPRWRWAGFGLLVVIALGFGSLNLLDLGKEPADLEADLPPKLGEMRSMPLPDETKVEMVYVPAGEYFMGTDQANEYERPMHTVFLDGFWIDRTEVTQAAFGAFVQATGYRSGSEQSGKAFIYGPNGRVLTEAVSWHHPHGPGKDLEGQDDHPVVLVTWDDAVAYCRWRGARLPTEAEWEKAARGTDGRKYPWGSEFEWQSLNFCDLNCPFDWRAADTDDNYGFTSPVGSYPAGASPYGVLDMEGNVREWVTDWYLDDYYQDAPSSNPQGPAEGVLRVARGSAWNDVGWTIRSTDRHSYDPAFGGDEVGFRCALDD